MTFFCISDLHGNLSGLDPSGQDIVIIAGDFSKMTGFGKWHLYEQKKWIEKKFIPFTQNHKNTQFVIIPGNHDLCLDLSKVIQYHDLNWKISWPENVHLLLNSSYEINGLKFYGTPDIPIINYRWAFEKDHDQLKASFDKIPENIDILISHSPPHIPDAFVDYSLQTANGPFGSNELTKAIINKSPKYVFCGHIHTGSHKQIDFNNTKIFNVSRLNEDYNIEYEPLLLKF